MVGGDFREEVDRQERNQESIDCGVVVVGIIITILLLPCQNLCYSPKPMSGYI